MDFWEIQMTIEKSWFLRINGEWQLSPAYDVTPNTVPYNKQHHALCFIEGKDLPSLALFNDIKIILRLMTSFSNQCYLI